MHVDLTQGGVLADLEIPVVGHPGQICRQIATIATMLRSSPLAGT
ncbi:hypothetical protein [Verminephrobacter eiseniae]|nr:hypothetical protein [Verminephrobacter eiseniae]